MGYPGLSLRPSLKMGSWETPVEVSGHLRVPRDGSIWVADRSTSRLNTQGAKSSVLALTRPHIPVVPPWAVTVSSPDLGSERACPLYFSTA